MRISLLILMLVSGAISAQVDSSNFSVDSELQIGNRGIDNSFLEYLIYGGRIDSVSKSDFISNLESENHISGELTFNGRYVLPTSFLKSDKFNPYVELGMVQTFKAEINEGFMELMLQGNASYLGEEVPLLIKADRFNAQYAGFGVKTMDGKLMLGARLYKGSDFIDGTTNSSTFYTSGDGDEINLDADVKVNFNNPSKTGIGALNGTGASLFASYLLNDKVRLTVEDLGMMWWSVKSQTIEVDSEYVYTGFDIHDLLGNSISSPDVSDTLGIQSHDERVNMFMPFRISIAKLADLSTKKIDWTASLRYRYLYNKLPDLMLGASFKASETTLIDGFIGYGGYYRLHGGVGINMILNSKVQLYLRSHAITHTLRNRGYGYNVNVGVRAKL